MSAYADTSFLLSLIGQDRNTPLAQARIGSLGHAPEMPWTVFGALEFNNAARALVFQQKLDSAGLTSIETRLRLCQRLGILRGETLSADPHYREAEMISAAHTTRLGTRTLDLLHVSAARVLKATSFLTFDLRQADLARVVGLRVVP